MLRVSRSNLTIAAFALLGIVCGISIVLILVFWRLFFRQAGDFAEEL